MIFECYHHKEGYTPESITLITTPKKSMQEINEKMQKHMKESNNEWSLSILWMKATVPLPTVGDIDCIYTYSLSFSILSTAVRKTEEKSNQRNKRGSRYDLVKAI